MEKALSELSSKHSTKIDIFPGVLNTHTFESWFIIAAKKNPTNETKTIASIKIHSPVLSST